MPQETSVLHSNDETSTFVKPDYSRQTSFKRRNHGTDVEVRKLFLTT